MELVYVVSTVPELPYPSITVRDRSEALLEQKRFGGLRLLEYQARRVESLGGDAAATHYREGRPEKEVVKLAAELDAGLIMTGGHRRHWLERVFGRGFSETVTRKADRPVLVVGQRDLRNSKVTK